MADAQPFRLDLGDDFEIEIPVDVPGGAPAVIDPSAPLEFGYGLTNLPADRANIGKPSATPQWGTMVIAGLTYPTVQINLPAAETGALAPYTTYLWACRVIVNGSPRTILRGSFRTAPVPI